MPRGYLKHKNRSIGAKRSQGGGSHPRCQPKEPPGIWDKPAGWAYWKDKVSYIPNEDFYLCDYYDDDLEAMDDEVSTCEEEQAAAASQQESSGSVFSLLDFVAVHEDDCTIDSWDWVTQSCDESTSTAVVEGFVDVLGSGLDIETDDGQVNDNKRSECCICLEERDDATKLMKRCKHPSACYECLRKTYVTQAQKDVSNYPLKCFYPSCGRLLHDEQVKRLVQSQDELDRHYQLSVMGRTLLAGYGAVACCPSCDHPRKISPGSRMNCYLCRKCHSKYLVETFRVFRVSANKGIFRFLDKECGVHGWAHCPQCDMVICKVGGCDEMHCFCGCSFSWMEAVRQKFPDFNPTSPMTELPLATIEEL